MAKTSAPTKPTVASLKAENKRLLAENAKLRKSAMASNTTSHSRFWQKFAIILCVSIAGALLVAGNLLFWAGNTLVDTNKFVATTTPLIKEPEIQQGVALYATTQLYQNVDIEQTIQDALPPKAEFLAPQLSSQVKTVTQTSFEKLLANQKFQDIWTQTLTTAHSRIINYVKNYQGDGTISLNDVFQKLTQNLDGTKLSFLSGKQLPSKVGDITIIDAGWLPTAHNIVTNMGLYQGLTTLAFLLFSAAAVWLAKNRRKLVMQLGVIYSLLMVATLASVRIAIHSISGSVNSAYQAAVKVAITDILHGLVMQSRTILALGVLTIIISWITGPSRAAVASRKRVNMLLEGKLHAAIFSKGENGFTKWVGAHKRLLQWASLAIVSLIVLIVELSPILVLWYALLLAALILLIELLAAPKATK